MIDDIKKNNSDGSDLINAVIELKKLGKYLWNKKWIIFITCFLGAVLGLTISFSKKTKYTAELSFVVQEKEKNVSGGLAGIASQFGLSIGGSSNVFDGDNMVKLLPSQRMIEETLLTPVYDLKEQKTLAQYYIEFTGMQKIFSKNENVNIRNISYPLKADRKKFTREQDSILHNISDFFSKEPLVVKKIDKKLSIISVSFTSTDEVFSKCFADNLLKNVTYFYIDTKTSLSKKNLTVMQHIADSIYNQYNNALYKHASSLDHNLNSIRQTTAIPAVRAQTNVAMLGSVYTEISKNIELMKLDMARETPLIQVIDYPIYPLKKDKLGKIKTTMLGGFASGFLIILCLLFNYYYRIELDKTSLKKND